MTEPPLSMMRLPRDWMTAAASARSTATACVGLRRWMPRKTTTANVTTNESSAMRAERVHLPMSPEILSLNVPHSERLRDRSRPGPAGAGARCGPGAGPGPAAARAGYGRASACAASATVSSVDVRPW